VDKMKPRNFQSRQNTGFNSMNLNGNWANNLSYQT